MAGIFLVEVIPGIPHDIFFFLIIRCVRFCCSVINVSYLDVVAWRLNSLFLYFLASHAIVLDAERTASVK